MPPIDPPPGRPATASPAIIALLMALRRNGVTDTAVLQAIESVDRARFVPEELAGRAWDDVALPIGYGQTISQPSVVGYMTQELEVGPQHKVLEIGTGSGYQTAILATLARRVYSIERIAVHARRAERRLSTLGIANVTVQVGDGTLGWPAQAPFDRIIVTAGSEGDPPSSLTQQLALNGILMIPLGDSAFDQRLVKIRKTPSGLDWEGLWPVRFVPLIAGDPIRDDGE